jgi:hypothetical protein
MEGVHEVELPNGEMFALDYENDLHLDRDELDIDWEAHPMRSFGYSLAVAEAKRVLDDLKREHRLLVAETYLDVKKNPEDYDLPDKPTVDQVKSAAESDEQCEDMYRKVINAQYELNVLQGALKALDDKKSAMENLVRLHGQSYFSTPQTDQEGGETLSDMKRDRVKATIKKKRSRKG